MGKPLDSPRLTARAAPIVRCCFLLVAGTGLVQRVDRDLCGVVVVGEGKAHRLGASRDRDIELLRRGGANGGREALEIDQIFVIDGRAGRHRACLVGSHRRVMLIRL